MPRLRRRNPPSPRIKNEGAVKSLHGSSVASVLHSLKIMVDDVPGRFVLPCCWRTARILRWTRMCTRSISGQFIVYASPQISKLARLASVAADTNFVRLEPALLAVSAERIKDSLWRRLEIKPGTPWRGQIYLVVHPRAVAGRGGQYHFQTAGRRLGLSRGTARCSGAHPFHPGVDRCVVAGTCQPRRTVAFRRNSPMACGRFCDGNARRRFVGVCFIRPRQGGERSAGHPDQRDATWIGSAGRRPTGVAKSPAADI